MIAPSPRPATWRWALAAGLAAGLAIEARPGRHRSPSASAREASAGEAPAGETSAGGASAGEAPASQPAGGSAAPTPAREDYPPQELVAACGRAAQSLRKRLDDTFFVAVEPPFVVAGDLPREQLEAMVAGSVAGPARALWASYFQKKPADVITVLLMAEGESYRKWAMKLFGDASVPHYGYYRHGERALVMNIGTGTGTLVHELTHSLIVYDFPDAPTWFNEGLASLHEQCRVGQREIVGLPNWRLPALQKAVAEGKLRPLRDLVTNDDFRGQQEGMNYAQARYFVMYMQQRGLLGEFYRHYRQNHDGPDSAVGAIEHVFKRKIEQVESDCLAWIKTLKFGR